MYIPAAIVSSGRAQAAICLAAAFVRVSFESCKAGMLDRSFSPVFHVVLPRILRLRGNHLSTIWAKCIPYNPGRSARYDLQQCGYTADDPQNLPPRQAGSRRQSVTSHPILSCLRYCMCCVYIGQKLARRQAASCILGFQY